MSHEATVQKDFLPINTRVSPRIAKKLKKLAEADEIALAAYVRRLLTKHVETVWAEAKESAAS